MTNIAVGRMAGVCMRRRRWCCRAPSLVLLLVVGCIQHPSESEVPILFEEPVNYHVGLNPTSVTSVDLNGDGLLDLLTTNSNSHNVSILLGQPQGTFTEHAMYDTGTRPRSLAVSDFDGDGTLDLAVVNNNSDDLSILLGKGGGTFREATFIPVGRSPMAVAAGDLDHDGQVDLAVVSRFDHLFLYRGNGDGTFTVSGEYDPGDTPTAIVLSHLNGDRHLDLVVSNNGPMMSNVAVFIGRGDGTFRRDGTYVEKTRPLFSTLAYLNDDAHLDLATVIPFANSMLVMMGNGQGAFQEPPSMISAEVEPEAVAVGDFNGDQKNDLAVVNMGSSSVSVLLGNGDGSFEKPRLYRAANRPISIVAADFNRDGWADLAVANNSSSSVSVLLALGELLPTPTAIEPPSQ